MSEREGMLSPYRVLDLTDERGLLCGKILGDLGADRAVAVEGGFFNPDYPGLYFVTIGGNRPPVVAGTAGDPGNQVRYQPAGG